MKLTVVELAREIRDKSNGELKTQDIHYTIKLLEEVIIDELRKGNDIKLRSLVSFKPVKKSATKAYDGLNKKYYDTPERLSVSIKRLGKIANIDKDK